MRRLTPHTTAVLVAALTVAGCGGSTTHTTTAASTPPTTTASRQATPTVLEQAVRNALNMNGRLSLYVLRSNKIPSWASQSTGGPALAGLAASASTRQKQRVHVRSLSEHFQVLAIHLAPSYTLATATVQDRQRVVLYTRGRHARTTTVNERDRVVLHRGGQAARFIVWEVQPE
jgi:hypothetical protein